MSDLDCGRIGRAELPGFTVSEFLLTGGYGSARHAHELSGLVLPMAGALTVAGSFGTRTIRPGEVLTLPAGTAHSERTAGVVVCLLLEPTVVTDADFDRVRVMEHPGILEAVRRLSSSLACSSEMAEWEPAYEAVDLLALVSRTTERSPSKAAAWLRRTAERLREEFSRPPSLADLAGEAGVSREHLAREFRRAMGLTVGDYVRRLQILEAVHLLRSSGLSTAQVALATGFTDASHLSRRVRRYLGVTPGMIRSAGGLLNGRSALGAPAPATRAGPSGRPGVPISLRIPALHHGRHI